MCMSTVIQLTGRFSWNVCFELCKWITACEMYFWWKQYSFLFLAFLSTFWNCCLWSLFQWLSACFVQHFVVQSVSLIIPNSQIQLVRWINKPKKSRNCYTSWKDHCMVDCETTWELAPPRDWAFSSFLPDVLPVKTYFSDSYANCAANLHCAKDKDKCRQFDPAACYTISMCL